MPQYRVAVSWTEVGHAIVTAPSLEAAIETVEKDLHNLYVPSGCQGEYLDDSFQVDKDQCELVAEVAAVEVNGG